MPEQALYLKWRPTLFDEVIGQEHIVHTLRNSLKTGRIRHAYLFSGPRGTGKTTTARLLAKAVNCTHPDVNQRPCDQCAACIGVNEGRYLDLIEIDAATHTGVDDVRDLREKIQFTPAEGRYKVYIIDEVHRFSGSAFDALLKTLEEPPAHAIFVLATTEIDKVPQTIKSRCLQFEFRRVSLQQVADRLERITRSEGLNVERGALELVARQGTGSVRDSISLLDQMVSDPSEVITLDIAQRILGTGNRQAVFDLVEALANEDIARGLHVINAAIDTGSDPRQYARQMVEHLRAVLLTQTAGSEVVDASTEERKTYTRHAEAIGRNRLVRALKAFNDAVSASTSGWQPQLALELAFIDSLKAPEVVTVQAPAAPAPNAKTTPPKATDSLTIEPTAPGAPPIIQPSLVSAKWGEMLDALGRYASTGPAVVEYFKVQRIDGNLLYISTNNELYYKRLAGQEPKLQAISRALYDVHQVWLRVQVELSGEAAHSGGSAGRGSPSDDPLLNAARELGARVLPESPE
ncbi:MAG: DNA polymerase III subunit gamma/tau [Anaerolineae bacterium]|nr:DNA polymerase III subunit gamma/tau [Anaerolineae bacterium]